MPSRPNPSEPRFFVRVGDHVDGPHPASRIRTWHDEGRIPDDALLSRDGQDWRPVRWPASGSKGGP